MEFDEDRFNLISEQLNHCLLPELDREIGNQLLDEADFHTFRHGLNMNLQLLFDIIGKNEQLLRGPFGDTDIFRLRFILLIHQQSGDEDAPFQTDVESIWNHLRFLTEKHYTHILSNPQISTDCMNYYKERIVESKWKKNIGAVYGYIQMYKIHQKYVKSELRPDEMMFMLSVAMLLTDYFEPLYKRFGLFLFNTLLDYGDAEYLSSMNIFEVIYNKIMNPLIHIISQEPETVIMLSCLYKCFRKFTKWHNPSEWNEIDDVLNAILKRLATETNNKLISVLITFVSSLTILPMAKSIYIQLNTNFEDLKQIKMIVSRTAEEKSVMISELRGHCKIYHNVLIGRWTKKLMEILFQQPIGEPEDVKLHLHVVHICYLCCFYGNPLMTGAICMEFLNKSIINCLQLVKNHRNKQIFADEIKEIMETFVDHLKRLSHGEKQAEIGKFQKSIEDLSTELSQKLETLALTKMN